MDNNQLNEVTEETTIKKDNGKRKLSKKMIIIILCSVIVIVISVLLCVVMFEKKSDNNVNDNNDVQEEINNNEEKEDEEKKESNVKVEDEHYSMVVYHQSDKSLCLDYSVSYCNEIAFKIEVEDINAKIVDYVGKSDNGYLLYIDKYVKLYNAKTKKIDVFDNLPSDYNVYSLIYDASYTSSGMVINKMFGIAYNNKGGKYKDLLVDDCKYYDIYDKKNKYNGYCVTDSVGTKYLRASNNMIYNDTHDLMSVDNYLIDNNTGKVTVKVEKDWVCGHFEIADDFIIHSDACLGTGSKIYYSKDGKQLTDPIGETNISDNNGYVYYYKDGFVVKTNSSGKVVTNNNFVNYEVYMIIDNYMAAVYGNKLLLIDLDTYDEYDLGEWNNYYFHTMISGYYDANSLGNDNEKKAGYYFVIGYHNNDTDDSGKEVYFDPVTKKVDSWELEEIGGYAKPVLYIYPKEKMDVEVSFEHNDYITTTYPKFKNSWKVNASPNGDLYDENGKYYYGLYWEENLNHLVNFNEGFYVEKDDAISFLEEKLSIIGLNDRERNEFIMYWLPILEKNEKNLVYFELTNERDSYNKLIINPKPDSLLRVAIHVKKVNKKVNIKKQILPSFNRKGFSVIEWGGVKY